MSAAAAQAGAGGEAVLQLIGMLDSPYVRRVAVSLQLLGLPFRHHSVSVFRQFDRFHAINPVVKAPTLVCADGTVLMDSTLIIDLAEALAGRSLLPRELGARQRALRRIGLALAVCEKAVQTIYEQQLRPVDKQHAPWLERVDGQLRDACAALEQELARVPLGTDALSVQQDGVSAAVAWTFLQAMLPQRVAAAACPHWAAQTAALERLPAFRRAPHGDGTWPVEP